MQTTGNTQAFVKKDVYSQPSGRNPRLKGKGKSPLSESMKAEMAKRNKARRELMREGKVSKGDGKVVDHKKPLTKGGGTGRSNLRVQSAKASHSQGGKLQPKSGKAKGGKR